MRSLACSRACAVVCSCRVPDSLEGFAPSHRVSLHSSAYRAVWSGWPGRLEPSACVRTRIAHTHTHTHYSLVPHAQRTHSRAHSLPQENLGLEAPPGDEGRAVFEGTLACPVASIGLATLSTGPVVANAIGQATSATETRRCDQLDLAQIGRTV